jgi:hypothetical protein
MSWHSAAEVFKVYSSNNQLNNAYTFALLYIRRCSAYSGQQPVRTLLIDNYDSYTYNLYHQLAVINGVEPHVCYNDDAQGSYSQLLVSN